MANLSAQQEIALAFLQAALVAFPVWLAASKFFIGQMDDIKSRYFAPDLILVATYICLLFIVDKSINALQLEVGVLRDAASAIYVYLVVIGAGMILLLAELHDTESARGRIWYASKLVVLAAIIAGLLTGVSTV